MADVEQKDVREGVASPDRPMTNRMVQIEQESTRGATPPDRPVTVQTPPASGQTGQQGENKHT